jgi:hypothetical protein
MKINNFVEVGSQAYRNKDCEWSISRLIELSKHLDILDIPLDHLNIYQIYNELSIRDMVMHIRAVNDCDLNFPIILDGDGQIMDGRHRIIKAILMGKKTTKAVRFNETPPPCRS